MENPHEQQQNALLGRIVLNVTKLNNSVNELNERLEELSKSNNDITTIAQMWAAYSASVQIHLETTKSFSEAL
ncbi:DASH complex subunit dad4 [Radiomyces spectabilis]|uniref:DASH complex subunit dad4 n=1 Tax=Radiomyces spectabilis TaxID=64574 RepID=UPI00221E3905|nr:DASH complex subunit dad4 [Radiomyces spectabilis]KAI8374413.1 DASH complex subunit dad4 [Radiomyces spectabilis]